MEIHYLPSFANDYEFIVCSKKKDSNEYIYDSVFENGWNAEIRCKELREEGFEPIIIHNVRIQGRRK